VAPKANCAPLCEETSCSWSCAKPTTCPRPKCELQCSKPACDVKDKQRCCKCNAKNVRRSLPRFEGEAHLEPSFLEVMAGLQHQIQSGVEECCPCKGRHHKSAPPAPTPAPTPTPTPVSPPAPTPSSGTKQPPA